MDLEVYLSNHCIICDSQVRQVSVGSWSSAASALRLLRRGAPALRARQYQLLCVDGLITTDQEYQVMYHLPPTCTTYHFHRQHIDGLITNDQGYQVMYLPPTYRTTIYTTSNNNIYYNFIIKQIFIYIHTY